MTLQSAHLCLRAECISQHELEKNYYPEKNSLKILFEGKKSGKFFYGREKNFLKKHLHKKYRRTHKQNKNPPNPSKNPVKSQFLRRDRNRGQPRAFAWRFSQKTT